MPYVKDKLLCLCNSGKRKVHFLKLLLEDFSYNICTVVRKESRTGNSYLG